MQTFKLNVNEVSELALVVSLPVDRVIFDQDKLIVFDDALAEKIASLLATETIKSEALRRFKTILIYKIDEKAEAERLKYITGGVGQAMIYQEKVAQAIDYSKAYADYKANPKANAKPNDNAYPLLSAGIGTDGATLLEVAETILHSYAIWRELSAEIEAIRLKAKTEIANAATVDEAQRIADAIEWPKSNG